MSKKAVLIIVYNHRFDKNIEVLEELYRHRFTEVFHLMPFYDGDKKNVITVYESSYQFQGYFAQGFKHFFSEEYDDYFFIGDDLILNPAINENTYTETFQLSENAAFIPEIMSLHHFSNNDTLRFQPVKSFSKSNRWYWWRVRQFITEYKHKSAGVSNDTEMPDYKEAESIFRRHGYEIKPLDFYDLYGGFFPLIRPLLKLLIKPGIFLKKVLPAYPAVASYSDIVIVPKKAIRKFCHYCGVLATNKMFVELAIPTALLLAAEKVVTEPQLGKRGSIYWTYTKEEENKYEEDMKVYNSVLKDLLKNFPKEKLYIHPVKLSKWHTSL